VPPRASRHFHGFIIAVTVCLAGLSVFALIAPASAQNSVQGSVHYVALGDSYSSGVGAGSYSDGSCEQSAHAFPVLWTHANGPASFTNKTCSGATTANVLRSQLSALRSTTTLVSITIGGNDVGFASVLTTCVIFSTRTCVNAIRAAESEMTSRLPGELNKVLAAIARDAARAKVVVLGYPELYDLSKSSACFGLSTTDRINLNQAADQLDAQIQAAAGRYHDVFAGVRAAFAGHELCDSDSWLYSVDLLNLGISYHPRASGQSRAYYPVFAGAAR
jgi:lysophospholipase L1-like esterase